MRSRRIYMTLLNVHGKHERISRSSPEQFSELWHSLLTLSWTLFASLSASSYSFLASRERGQSCLLILEMYRHHLFPARHR